MEIILQEPLTQYAAAIYLGNRKRHPSVTDVVFVSEHRIVVAHRYGCKLCYIQLNSPTEYTILDELLLTIRDKPHPTEMMDIVGSTIYLISFTPYMSIIDIRGDKLHVRTSIRVNNSLTPYHGIQAANNVVYITPANIFVGDDRIVVWDTEKNKIAKYIQSPNLTSDVRIKDITFVTEDRVVLFGVYKGNDMLNAGHSSNGFIGLYTKDFVQLDRIEFENVHFDSVTSKDGTFFGTGADMEGGYIYVGTIGGDKLSPIVKHRVQDFPHGIAVYNDKLAYTSYKTSAVYITDIATFMQ
jgi:hypothetical protein